MEQHEIISEITKAVTEGVERRRRNAGFSGMHGDNGASQSERELKCWLDGIQFAKTGKTETYKDLLQKLENERDPEYQEYQRLKQKFEK
jgi:hypothetical protein